MSYWVSTGLNDHYSMFVISYKHIFSLSISITIKELFKGSVYLYDKRPHKHLSTLVKIAFVCWYMLSSFLVVHALLTSTIFSIFLIEEKKDKRNHLFNYTWGQVTPIQRKTDTERHVTCKPITPERETKIITTNHTCACENKKKKVCSVSICKVTVATWWRRP